MRAQTTKLRFNEKSLNESFEHARELKFSEDFESKPAEETKVSKTANLFGDFYFTSETAGSKALASKVVNQELKDMRERLQWGTLAAKAVPKEEFQSQLSKSKFMSLFLVMRRVTGRHQYAMKKKCFKHWVEWLKAFMILYRSRPRSLHPRSRSSSPNTGRLVKFRAEDGVDTDSARSHAAHHHHPHDYHFHGDRQTSPQQMRKELYLHHDLFLTSQDADVEEAVMHHLHPHASNHPERDYKPPSKFQSPNRKASHRPDVKHAHAVVPSHIVPKHVDAPHSPSPSRTGTISSTASAAARERTGKMSPQQLRKELYLHHDMFLTSQEDDVADAVLHKVHPHASNHPEQEFKQAGDHHLHFAHHGVSVPSHVVPKHAAPAHSPSPNRAGTVSSTGSAAARERTAQLSPQQLRKELYLHHDMFLSSQDDIAEAVLHKVHPHASNHPEQEAISRFASPKRRASMRQMEAAQKEKEAAHALVPSHIVPKQAGRSRSPSPDRHPHNSPALPESPVVPELALGTSTTGSPGKVRVSCRALDTLAGSRKDAHILHKGDPVEHVKAIAAGQHHSTKISTPRAISPSLYASGAAPAVKPFNHTRDKKHDPKPRMSHSPSRHLPEEHAAKIVSAVVAGNTSAEKSAASHSDSSDYEDSSDSEDSGNDGEGRPARAASTSQLNGLELTKGLRIRTDNSVGQRDQDTASVGTASTAAVRRNSFSAPTVSHILKLAHKSDSVEKVAQKVKHKRSAVKQALPKSPHPTQTFPIIPEELVAKRAERRTSFRSPTKSHAIKLAAKLGDEGSVYAGPSSQQLSPDSPARRKSFADSLPSARSQDDGDVGMVSIRTYIPFSGARGPATTVTAVSTSAPPPATSPGKTVRRGSTANSHAVTPRRAVYCPVTAHAQAAAQKANAAATVVNTTVSQDDGDDASVAVYSVGDDLDNLFDMRTPKASSKAKGSSAASATTTAVTAATSPAAASPAVVCKYKPGTPKYNSYMQKVADQRSNKALVAIFAYLGRCHDKLGKTASTRTAFAVWKTATGWFRRLEERVPQSVMYLLQVEKEVLWRVYCVYCPQKHRIPFSPPVTSVAPVLSPEAVERLASGYSAHHDHHAHTAAVAHPYHDIHQHHSPQHKEATQAQLRHDAHLHHDIFLHTTNDADLAELELLKAHRHAMNHPEEGLVVHHDPTKHQAAPVQHHHDAVRVHPHQHEVGGKALHRDLHLHHDIFLSSEDRDLEELAVTHHHPHAPNHPEDAVIVHDGHVSHPAPLSPLREHSTGAAAAGPSQASPTPPQTPLYGLFTVLEGDGDQGDQHDGAEVRQLQYGASPAPSSSSPQATRKVPKDMELQVSHGQVSSPTTLVPASEVVAQRASTRFRKHLLDLDGLWHLMQDFNLAPYLFCKVKLGEMFDRCISLQPACSDPAPAPVPDPLEKLPDFNVYRADAPELRDPEPPRPGSPRDRLPSAEGGKRGLKVVQEAVAGNGTRRAFTSPDGKVQIKLTCFRSPGTVDASTPYIAAVVNPRSKSPAAVLTAAQKKKQEDDFVRAIVAANRKAAAEKVAAERTRRRSAGSAPAAAVAGAGAGSGGKRPDRPARGMHIAPAEKERRPSVSPDRYRPIAELDLFKVEAHSPARDHPMISFHSFVKMLWEMAASYMDIPVDEEGGEDSHSLRALRAFVHALTRYRARVVTKEVEKVLPLLEHDHDLRHKALRLYH